MAGEAAIRKVLTALHGLLDGNLGAGVTVVIDRSFNQPFRDEELPAVNVRCQQVTRSQMQYNVWLHDAQIAFDIITRSATTQTVDEQQANIEATIAEVLLNPPGTITAGSFWDMITDAVPVGFGQRGDEFDLADQGESTSLWRVPYLTPINDFRTIEGRLGPIA